MYGTPVSVIRQALTEFLPTGLPALDHFLGGGWLRGGVSELAGEEGSGKTSLVLRSAAALTQQKGLMALVTHGAPLFPPALSLAGVRLKHVLWLRPESLDRCRWAAEQVVRSGLFPLVILSRVSWEDAAARRLQLAAETAGCAVLLLSATPNAKLSWTLLLRAQIERLSTSRLHLHVLKSRKFLTQLHTEVSLESEPNPVDPFSHSARSRIAS